MDLEQYVVVVEDVWISVKYDYILSYFYYISKIKLVITKIKKNQCLSLLLFIFSYKLASRRL